MLKIIIEHVLLILINKLIWQLVHADRSLAALSSRHSIPARFHTSRDHLFSADAVTYKLRRWQTFVPEVASKLLVFLKVFGCI